MSTCDFCGLELTRKIWESGEPENMAQFKRRRHCGVLCANQNNIILFDHKNCLFCGKRLSHRQMITQAKCCSIRCSNLKRGKYRYRSIKINGKRKQLHRYVVECHLGRTLLPTEHVHHINENRYDNRIQNLEVLSAKEHALRHRGRRKIIQTKQDKQPLNLRC